MGERAQREVSRRVMMRGACLVAALASLASLLGAAGAAHGGASARLPASVVPERYRITFEPDLKASSFVGKETIEVEVRAATHEVRLHAVDLTITTASVAVGREVWKAQVTPDAQNEMIVLALPRPLPVGTATLTLHWTAKLSTRLRGLYAAESEGRRYAFTQFEATDARRAFPGFDEPAMKARFEVTAVIDPALAAISNGRIVSSTVQRGKRTVRFAETPPMSSYLVALAVGPLVEASCGAGPVRVCVWSPPGKQHLGGFAREAAEAFLPRFVDYFGIPYPYGKLDLVAVPDFAAGAMENTAAIFFREARLLVDPKTASAEQRRGVADIIAHEMAHQWFGDLVTMQWWDDLWLNEAFATWMEMKIIDGWRPDWNMWTEFEGWKAYALSMDQLAATHPIRTPVTSPDQVNENFDSITYAKGASVLRMLEIYLGEAAFQKGVQRYLVTHANGNATADDLWRALTETSGQPVREVAASWLDQPGHPVVSVSQRCRTAGAAQSTELTLSQRRFFADAGAAGEVASSQQWLVPVCVRAGTATQCELMRGRTATIALRAPGCAPWVLVNPHHSGFYRVRYDAPVLKALGRAAQASLDAPERIGLVSDAWALVKQGALPLVAYLETVQAMKGERTREVISTLHEQLGYLEDHLVRDADRPAFRAFVARELAPLHQELGWEAAPDEPDTRRLLRASVLWTLGTLGRVPAVLAEAKRRLPVVLAAPATVDPNVAEPVVYIAAQTGDGALYDSYLKHMRAAANPDLQMRLLFALGSFEEPAQVQRTLDLLLTPEVRAQDVARLVGKLMYNRKARAQTWTFVRAHFDALKKKSPEFGFQRLVGATGHFCDEASAREVAAFFADPAHKIESSERTLRQAVEEITLCSAFKKREAGNLSTWLRARR